LLQRTKLAKGLNQLKRPQEITNAKGRVQKVKHQNASCVIPYIGLLCQGKTDYEDIRELQEDIGFNCRALHINTIPSAETVRRRFDDIGLCIAASDMVMEEGINLLKNVGLEPSPVFTGHVPIDIDVSIHDNSKTKKEGVEPTYKKGVDGYAPIYAYIGEEGYVCNVELREGSCHSQCETTPNYLEDTLRMANGFTSKKLLVRMDSGNDSFDNIKLFIKAGADFLIKRNLRGESKETWFDTAKAEGRERSPRVGKTVYTGSVYRDKGLENPVRIVFKVTERTIRSDGQVLIEPEIDVQTWWTSLSNPEDEIIRLYREHATCEQFHAEIKDDIGLELFPSGKIDTNAAILKLAALSYNILRIVGQSALGLGGELTRHEVKRLRAKTVIQRFMMIAGRVIEHARQTYLTLGRSNIWRHTFTKLYEAFG
jgi:hypothetical protein